MGASAIESTGRERIESLMQAELGVVVGRPVTGRDAVAAGALSGHWRRLERDLARGLALREAGQVPAADLHAAVNEFRRQRRLISAEDFRAWLAQRGLDIIDVSQAVERELLRRAHVDRPTPGSSVSSERLLWALPAEAICSGTLSACAWWLADRLLVAEGRGARADDGALAAAAAAEAELVTVSALGEDTRSRLERLSWVLSANTALAEYANDVATPAALEELTAARRLDWIAFELEGMVVGNEGAAAEAAMLLRGDDRRAQSVVGLAGVDLRRREVRLESAPAPLAAELASALTGDVIGPLPIDSGYELWRVAGRTPPELDDPAIRERAAAGVLQAALARLRAGRISWNDNL